MQRETAQDTQHADNPTQRDSHEIFRELKNPTDQRIRSNSERLASRVKLAWLASSTVIACCNSVMVAAISVVSLLFDRDSYRDDVAA